MTSELIVLMCVLLIIDLWLFEFTSYIYLWIINSIQYLSYNFNYWLFFVCRTQMDSARIIRGWHQVAALKFFILLLVGLSAVSVGQRTTDLDWDEEIARELSIALLISLRWRPQQPNFVINVVCAQFHHNLPTLLFHSIPRFKLFILSYLLTEIKQPNLPFDKWNYFRLISQSWTFCQFIKFHMKNHKSFYNQRLIIYNIINKGNQPGWSGKFIQH